MSDTNKGVDRRVFLRFLSGGALAVASGGLLAGCGGGGAGGGSNGNHDGTQTFNYPDVALGGQAGSLSVTTRPGGAASGSLVVPVAGGAARPRVATPLPTGSYALTGTSTTSAGGFAVSGTATFTPSPASASVTAPFTLAVTTPTATAAGSFTFTFNGSAYSGSIPAANAVGTAQLGGQAASLNFTSVSGISPPPENPIGLGSFIPATIQIVWNSGSIQSSQIVQYHVFRDPEPAALVTGSGLNASAMVAAAYAPLPAFAQPTSPAYDSVQDLGPLFIQLPDPADDTQVATGNFYQTVANGNGGTFPGEFAISGTGLQVGDRVRYRIQALYKVSSGGTQAYALSTSVYTNHVTYLQPVLLSETNTQPYPHVTSLGPNTPDNDVFGLSTGPADIVIAFRSVYINPNNGGGLKYVLDFSTDSTFSSNIHRYSQVEGAQSGSETNPRGVGNGAVVMLPSSNTSPPGPVNLVSAFGASPGSIYVRVGVRDVLDPEADSSYVYSTLDSQHFTDPVSRSYLLPSALTP